MRHCARLPAVNHKPGLRRTPPHVAQLAAFVEAPDWADLVGNIVAEIGAHAVLLVLVAGRQH
jgi:hypothetical protein